MNQKYVYIDLEVFLPNFLSKEIINDDTVEYLLHNIS